MTDTAQPPAQTFELRITATGEVRDADGNLVSQEPVEIVQQVTAEEAASLGLIPDGDSAA